MSRWEWNEASPLAVAHLQSGRLLEAITEEKLIAKTPTDDLVRKRKKNVEEEEQEQEEVKKVRACIPSELLPVCLKMPWFHKKDARFRQTLAMEKRDGVTLRDVVRAMNFLFQRPYSEDEIEFLGNYFQRMKIPTQSVCLTTIVEVFDDLNEYLEKTKAATAELQVQSPMVYDDSNHCLETPVVAIELPTQSQVVPGERVRYELVSAREHNSELLDHSNMREVTEALSMNGHLLYSHDLLLNADTGENQNLSESDIEFFADWDL